MRVLVIEDERRLAENIARSVRESAGYAVDCAFDGENGLYMAKSNSYDLIMVDLMLPGRDGLSVVQELRRGGANVPILVLTARDEKESVVALLNAGADDYVTKPFDLGELIARAKALIRRGKGESDTVLRFHDLEMNIADHTVHRDGKPVSRRAWNIVCSNISHTRAAQSFPKPNCWSICTTSIGRDSAT